MKRIYWKLREGEQVGHGEPVEDHIADMHVMELTSCYPEYIHWAVSVEEGSEDVD